MKPGLFILSWAALSISATAAPFQNLRFDNANTDNVLYDRGKFSGVGTTTDLLPGWQLYFGRNLHLKHRIR